MYAKLVWVRKIGVKGDALAVTLPSEAREALGWKRGEYLLLRMHSMSEMRIIRFDPAQVTDRVRKALEPLPIIKYGRKHREGAA